MQSDREGEGQEVSHPIRLEDADAVKSYHQFRYNFKPASVDHEQAGEVRTRDSFLERQAKCPSQVQFKANKGGDVEFDGYFEPQKPGSVECVLIFNPDKGEYVLKKTDASFNLTHSRRLSGRK